MCWNSGSCLDIAHQAKAVPHVRGFTGDKEGRERKIKEKKGTSYGSSGSTDRASDSRSGRRMKAGKSERERSGRRRHRSGDALTTVVVKQERLSPEPVAHRRPDAPAASLSPPAAEPGHSGHRGSRARSPAKKKSKSSGRRSKSPRTKRSRSPHYPMVKVKQEREDHPRRGREDRQHREPSEQEHRRARNSERDRHRGHSRQGRSSDERPVSGQDRDRDSQNLQAQEEERDFHNARCQEHRPRMKALVVRLRR